MLSTQDFIRLFTLENDLILSQTAGLSQADTFIQPQPSGNCMHWVLGHILQNQISLLGVLGGVSPVDAAPLAIYKTGSDPITSDRPGLLQLEHLRADISAVNTAINNRLAEMSDDDFSQEIEFNGRKSTLAWRFLFLQFHYSTHVGQLEQLRQLAGHNDKIV